MTQDSHPKSRQAERQQIRSLTGSTRDGAPLALSRAPIPELRPWYYWWSVAEGELPAGVEVKCGMLGDHACIRLLYGGRWTAQTADGPMVFDPGHTGTTLYFGPQSRYMPISVTGSYKAITLHFVVGAPTVLGGPSQAELVDRIVDYDELVGKGRLTSHVPIDAEYGAWVEALEHQLLQSLRRTKVRLPDPLSAAFERECLAGPDFTIKDFARQYDTSVRTVERIIKRDYGLPPKHVLRRARAVDMAASLLGVVRDSDRPEMELRYFDQPHQIREIRTFFDMRPGDLAKGAHPFLRLNMESRQSRRLDALAELGSEKARPWRVASRDTDIGRKQ